MKKIKSYNFDWDDNIMFMPTKILVFHKETNEGVAVSTEEFGQIRSKIGAEGKYKDYKINNDEKLPDGTPNPTFSFVQFRDRDGVNSFLPQVKEALKNPNCFGPSFKSFCKALSSPDTAKRTTIITARGHQPKSLHEALVYLKSLGHFKYLPTVENMHPVSSEKYAASAAHPSEKKLDILLSEIDKMEKNAKNGEVDVATGFSDDDFATYQNVKKVIEEQSKKGRWPNTKVVLYYTGHNKTEKLVVQTEQRESFVA
jgi:hypothetical protein